MNCEYCAHYPLCSFLYQFAKEIAKRTKCPEKKDHSIADYIENYLRRNLRTKEVVA